jgi:hypothetical protein
MSAQPASVCDICGAGLSSPGGYLLVTREVVSEPKYWQHYYRQHEAEFALLGVRSYEAFKSHQDLRAMAGKTLAGQSSPWMVCENCIGMFQVDRQAARRHAEQWWQSGGTFAPPGVGKAPLSAVNMDEAQPPSPRPAARKEGVLDRLMRPQRIKRMWQQATKIGGQDTAETRRAICTELLGMLDERSKEPDIGRVYIVRGSTYGEDQSEEALADYGRAADFYLRKNDLNGILDCEDRMRIEHESRIPRQAPEGSEKGQRLQRIHSAAPPRHGEWNWGSATELEKLCSHLGDPDVRAYASLRIGGVSFFAPEAKKWLVDYYRKCLSADDDRAALVGRHVGSLLFMGPHDVFPADLTFLKLGKDVPKSFVNCPCAHCGYLNRGIPVPPTGAVTPYHSSKGRQGKYSVLALCVRCNREFFLAWDTDPRR